MTRRKTRPERGDPIYPGMSHRDIAAAAGISTRQMWQWMQMASIPKQEFERVISQKNPKLMTTTAMVNLARRRDGIPDRKRTCPHCGGEL